MRKITKRINVIFTGRYLKFWYIAFAIVILLMAFNMYRLKNVKEFELTVYNTDGTIQTQRIVGIKDLDREQERQPISKSFRPIK